MIRNPFASCAAALALLCAPLAAVAQPYPTGPITIVIPLAAGDSGDTTVRAMSEELSRQLNVPILVANRPGAGGAIGVQSVIAARKDGYTLLFTQNGPLTIRRVLEPQAASYDPAKDLTPLGISTRTPSILVVRKDAPFRNFQDFIAQAKKAPGSVRIGTPGTGSAADISVQVINSVAGVDITAVPYKGASPAVTDVLGGQVEGVILALGAVSAHIKSGALRPLAISSPFPDLPDVPTLSKLGYKQEIQGVWFGFFAPAGVPPEVAQTLVPALERSVKNPAIAARLQPLGISQEWSPAARLSAEIAAEYETVGELTRKLQPRKP
ncbi:MAG: tripartite tricarboxylate transporter substrate binding protein [Ramlibacter sp.]|nr:tripartite tricarboxylate transporter substrate binding protein [Ramlibacter sp.]